VVVYLNLYALIKNKSWSENHDFQEISRKYKPFSYKFCIFWHLNNKILALNQKNNYGYRAIRHRKGRAFQK
jgi:hypothetical protein